MTTPTLRVLAALTCACAVPSGLRADLIVLGELMGMSADYTIRRFDERTGAYLGDSHGFNEGWTALARASHGRFFAASNVLGSGVIQEFAADGALVRELAEMGVVASLTVGPDGYLYASGALEADVPGGQTGIVRFDPRDGRSLGTFLVSGDGYESVLAEITFGPDGHLYAIASGGIVKHHGGTGASLGVFVPLGRGGLADPSGMAFGPGGHLYVSSRSGNSVLQFNGATGAFMRALVAAGTGGLAGPSDLAFAGDSLLVASHDTDQILRYAAATGAFLGPINGGGMVDGPNRLLATGVHSSTDVDWFGDALPPGATGGASGGDSWTWVSTSTAPRGGPVSGKYMHVSANMAGKHEHFFNFAQPFSLGADDSLYVYFYATHPPRQVMLSWNSGKSWEHRAYWGENLINAGVNGTASRHQVSATVPSSGGSDPGWRRLEVPAAAVGLAGKSVVGMSFTLFDGGAAWDRAGRKPGTADETEDPDPPEPPPEEAPTGVWFDRELPPGARPGSNPIRPDAWTWQEGGPLDGSRFHRSSPAMGLQEKFFTGVHSGLPVAEGATLYVYVRIPADTPPAQLMVSWLAGNWEHRAYWGANRINYGKDGTASRRPMGALPATGKWVRLEIPASAVDLEGRTVTGMSFSLFDGGADWSAVGSAAAGTPAPEAPAGTATVWFEDAFPNGSRSGATGGAWTWAQGTPAAKSGSAALHSTLAGGMHEQWFNFAWEPLAFAAGDKFFIHVYLDPANPPRQLVLSFNADNWEHRAYWGENLLRYATDGSPAQKRIGDLPTSGQWVRLEVPAEAVGLPGLAVKGLSLTLFDGRASFDQAGRLRP